MNPEDDAITDPDIQVSDDDDDENSLDEPEHDDEVKLLPSLFQGIQEEGEEPTNHAIQKIESTKKKKKKVKSVPSGEKNKNQEPRKKKQKIPTPPESSSSDDDQGSSSNPEDHSSSSSDGESSVEEEEKPPKKTKRTTVPLEVAPKVETKQFSVNDSTARYFLDPRKIRRTPLPSSISGSPSGVGKNASVGDKRNSSNQRKIVSTTRSSSSPGKKKEPNVSEIHTSKSNKNNSSSNQEKKKKKSTANTKRSPTSSSSSDSESKSGSSSSSEDSESPKIKTTSSSSANDSRRSSIQSTSSSKSKSTPLERKIKSSPKNNSSSNKIPGRNGFNIQQQVSPDPERRFAVPPGGIGSFVPPVILNKPSVPVTRTRSIHPTTSLSPGYNNISPTSKTKKREAKSSPSPTVKEIPENNNSEDDSVTSSSGSGSSSSSETENDSEKEEGTTENIGGGVPEQKGNEEKKKKSHRHHGKKKKKEKKHHHHNEQYDELKRRIAEEEKKEKQELVYEFWLMEKNGIMLRKKYTHEDDLDEMRFEYHRMKSEKEIQEKIKMGWGIFSLVNTMGVVVTNKFPQLGIPLAGWDEELGSQRAEYEQIFRKIYKNMATRFYVRPGLTFAITFGTQFLLFLGPKLIKKIAAKSKSNNQDDDDPEADDIIGRHKRVEELDEDGNTIPSGTSQKIEQLQSSLVDLRRENAESLQRMQQQQVLLLQAQQRFFDSITTELRTNTAHYQPQSQNVVNRSSKKGNNNNNSHRQQQQSENDEHVELSPPMPRESSRNYPVNDQKEVPSPSNNGGRNNRNNNDDGKRRESESEYEYVPVEVTDDDDANDAEHHDESSNDENEQEDDDDQQITDNRSTQNSQEVNGTSSIQKTGNNNNAHRVTSNDESYANSLGQVITNFTPLVNLVRSIKAENNSNSKLNSYMYTEPPPVPEHMQKHHESLKKRGLLKESPEKDNNINKKNASDTVSKESEVDKSLSTSSEPSQANRNSSKRQATLNLDDDE